MEAKATNAAITNPVAKAAECAPLTTAMQAIDLTTQFASAESLRDSTLPKLVEFKGTRPWQFTDPNEAAAVIAGTLDWNLKFELVAQAPK